MCRLLLGCCLSGLLLAASALRAQEPKPPALTSEEQKLADEATKLNEDAVQLDRRGRPAEAVVKMKQALEIRRKLFPESKFPDGHPELAQSLNNMGFVLQAMGQAEKALGFYQQGLEMYQKLFPASRYPARGVAAKNTLGYVGLVLAEGKVLSGLSILDLPLENLKLVSLSACETGLGQYTGGEGVQGLQRAFHMAGCENVVASLWQVNDDATAALMRRFYHHLWEKGEPPIQALRLAQLELYHNPTQVADLVRGGAPKFAGGAKPLLKSEQPKPGERAATKLWAAFVLSGVGK